MLFLKAPLLFAEGGEKEEKAGAKNEKAILIISKLTISSIQFSPKIKENLTISSRPKNSLFPGLGTVT